MTQPLPDNLHPSQCYRLLDPERDTLQEGDEEQSEMDASYWDKVEPNLYGKKPTGLFNYRRPFTPPAPVQVQEFWRLLEVRKDFVERGDEFTINHESESVRWNMFPESQIGKPYTFTHCTARRRVTVPVAAPAPVADAPKAEPSSDYGKYRQRLFEYLDQNLGHAPIESEMDEIENIVLGYHRPLKVLQMVDGGPYLVSVDGHEAPTMEHATIEEARTEAERLARQEHPARVRVLRQVAVASAKMTVKWEETK